MNIISIDAITPVLSISARGPAGLATLSLSDSGKHANSIITVTNQVLELAGFSASETELLVCPEGPGSFTGLRLSWAAARAIQLTANCPLRPVQALDCYSSAFSYWPGVVLSVLDAKKNRFYARFYRKGSPCSEPMDISPQYVIKAVDPEEKILITGPDAELFASLLRDEAPLLDILSVTTGSNGVSDKMLLFAESLHSSYTEIIADNIGPLYVRKSDAEI